MNKMILMLLICASGICLEASKLSGQKRKNTDLPESTRDIKRARTANNNGSGDNRINLKLFDAIRKGDIEHAQQAIEQDQGDSINAKNYLELTPLALACIRGQTEIAKLLLNENAADVPDNFGYTLLHQAIGAKNLDLVKLVLTNCNLIKPSKCGWTPLIMACYLGNERIVQYILDQLKREKMISRAINAYDKHERTALHFAAEFGYVHIIEMLLKADAAINFNDIRFNTPLHKAVTSQNLDAVKMLIKAGAKLDCKNKLGLTPLDLADQSDNVALKRIFRPTTPPL